MGPNGDRRPLINTISAIILSITTILFLLRCYVRIGIQKKRFLADDHVILFAYANFLALTILTFVEVAHGTGEHLVDVEIHNPADVPKTLLSWWIGQHLYIFATCSVKISVVIFFCSLEPPRNLRIIAIITACISVLTGIATEVYQIFQCSPISYFWERLDPGVKGSCLSPYKSFVILETVNSFDIFTDMTLALLPAIMLWNVNMKRVEKFCVSMLLGLGALPTIAAIIRAFYFKSEQMSPKDFTYTEFPVGVTSHLEPAIAISVVCTAHLRPLLRKIFPKYLFSSSKGSSESNVVTFGRAGGRPHGISEISLDERLDSGICDKQPLQREKPDVYQESSFSTEGSH